MTNRNMCPRECGETTLLSDPGRQYRPCPGELIWDCPPWRAIANLDGVTGVAGKSNDSGKKAKTVIVPAHSIAFVVEGGGVADITEPSTREIQNVSTYGDVSATFDDDFCNEFQNKLFTPKAVAVNGDAVAASGGGSCQPSRMTLRSS